MPFPFPPRNDALRVEYCVHSDGTNHFWCIWRGRDVLALEPDLDTALAAAKRIARANDCDAWLIGPAGPMLIDLSEPDRT